MKGSPVERSVLEKLLFGAAPKCKEDVHALWENYDPKFWICEDASGILFQARWDSPASRIRPV